jgi:tetratricopeptide (TPR) repeat protein
MARVFASLSEILRSHGGTVEKFIGDAIMTVFGVPAAHDDDPERAVRAAFECRSRLEELRAGSAVALVLRIGVNTGEAVADTSRTEQFLVTGTPVNLASRLQQAAAPGEILVGALTQRLTRGAVTYGDVREIDAKGFGRVTAWPAERLASALSVEHRGLEGRRAPLIGREDDLRLLGEAYARVERDRTASLVTIHGPPGVGKTRLLAEFAAIVGPRRCFTGRCLPYGQGITLYPIQQILRAHLGIDPSDDRTQAATKLAARLEALIDDDRERGALGARLGAILGLALTSDPRIVITSADIAEELRWGVRTYFERASEREACVLVFEDVHRAEDALLDLIEHLTASTRAPLLIVCLARDDISSARKGWGSRAATALTVPLAPLTDDGARALVAALDDRGELNAAARAEVVSRAEGNPLYVEELLRVFVDPQINDGRAASSAPDVPATLQGVIAARLDRVTPEVKALLQRASLVGRLFSAAALEAIGGAPVRVDLLRDAIDRDLLIETDETAPGGGEAYRFKHGLIREVAYGTVPKGERVRMHDNYGRWLDERFGDRRFEVAEIVAYHAEQAFLLATELGRPGAEELGARALASLNAVAMNARHRQDRAALGLYERAVAVATRLGSESAMRSEAIAGLAVTRFTRFGERDGLERAREMFRGSAPTEMSMRVLTALGYALMADGRPAEYMPILDQAVAIARAIGDPNLIAEALGVRANASYQSGDAASYVRLVDEALEYARRSGAARQLPVLLVHRHVMAARRAEFTLALEIESEIEAAAPHPLSTAALAWQARRTALRCAMGDSAGAVRIAERSLEIAREHASRLVLALQLWHLGEALLELGQAERARDILSEATTLFTQLGQRGQIPEVTARRARARIRLGDLDGARADLEIARAALIPADVESVSIVALASAELSDALGDASAADGHFREAVAALEDSLFRAYLAQARTAYARFLIRQRRSDEARGQLEAARSIYRDELAGPRRDEIDELLLRCKVSVP